jgi:3-oxoadipate enol-lactonase
VAYTTVDGACLYWEASGEGDPLLLIQGLGFSSAMWFRLLPALEARHHVVRYDARGIGRSDVPPGPYTIERMAADAAAVLDAAGVDAAHVFGCSLGGIVAQEFAITYPDRLMSLVLCCTHPAGTDAVWPEQAVMDMLRDRTALSPEESIRASVPFAYSPTTPQERVDEDVQRRIDVPNTAEGYTNQLMGGLGYPGTKSRLGQIRVPTLVMTGDADQMVPPANTDILAEAIPDARTLLIRGAGHVVFTDAPDEVATAMLEFLSEAQTDARR